MNYYAYQVPMLSDRLYVCPNALSGQCNGYICGLVHPGMCVVMCVYVCVLWCVLSVCLGMAQIRCSSIPLCIQSHMSVAMWTAPSPCAGISSEGTAIALLPPSTSDADDDGSVAYPCLHSNVHSFSLLHPPLLMRPILTMVYVVVS